MFIGKNKKRWDLPVSFFCCCFAIHRFHLMLTQKKKKTRNLAFLMTLYVLFSW